MENDAQHRFPCAWRELVGTSNEIAGGIVDQHIQRPGIPDPRDHLLHGVAVAHITDKTADVARPAARQFSAGLLQYVGPAATDVDRCAELQKALGHRAAEACAASGDQDAFAFEQICLKHSLSPLPFAVVSTKASQCATSRIIYEGLRSVLLHSL